MDAPTGKAVELIEKALVANLTVVDPGGNPVTYPLIPLWDGKKIWMTSSVLFSRKLEHIKSNKKVAVSISDPNALDSTGISALTIQGDARVIEDDIHDGWAGLLPLWEAKEPVVRKYLRQRFALPLFWERSMIEITPSKVTVWRDDSVPETGEFAVAGGAR